MSGPPIPPSRMSRSPVDDFHLGERKRRRKALSCYDCRRRKLKCDREYPSCGRCRKAGQADSCFYEAGPLEPVERDSKDNAGIDTTLPGRADTGETFRNGLLIPPKSITQPSRDIAATAGRPFADEESSTKLAPQARRIAQLESKVASLEAGQPSRVGGSGGLEASEPSGTLQSFGEVATVAESRDERTALKQDSFWTSPREAKNPETILFRGKNFTTQYYGGSNPTSLIAHVQIFRFLVP